MTVFAWSPSGLRTIGLFATAMNAPIGRIPALTPLRWPAMPAGAMLDVTLDTTGLQASAADTLTVTVNAAANVTLSAPPMVTGALVLLWLTAGSAGADATVDLTIATASGFLARRIVRLWIY